MTANKAAFRWCVVYTRKSSEEGLEQQFNSLHAQREAAEAYIKSQRHEGWRLLAEKYDDGGFSGGNLERPALKRLVADIRAGKVQTVVVYKVDRLTRSLNDFAQLIELFEAREVTFVSVTQHHLDGPADAKCAAVLRSVRARGDRRAHPGQDRGGQEKRSVDGRHAADRL